MENGLIMKSSNGFQGIFKTISAIADWFLILAGVAMMLLGWFRIDVIEMRYLLLFCGGFFILAGCWFRFRSWRNSKA
jgi:hypothetical protein